MKICNKIKHILVISPYFSPINMMASIRMTKLVKYLSRSGEYRFTVVCYECSDFLIYSILELDIEECKDYVDIIRVHPPVDLLKCMGDIIRFARKVVSSKENDKEENIGTDRILPVQEGTIGRLFRYIDEANYLFSSRVYTKNVMKSLSMELLREVDLMITSYGPISSLMIGNKIKKMKPQIKWIVDYRDPIVEQRVWTSKKRINISKNANEAAEYITLVTQGCKGTNDFENKYVEICNGFDIEDYNKVYCWKKENEKFTITYTGQLHDGKRRIGDIFKIIENLVLKGKIDINRIEFFYAGSDSKIFIKEAIRHNLQKIVRDKGFISREKALELQFKSDILCLLSWNNKGDENVLTGKCLEYLMMKKPIFAYVSGDMGDSMVKRVLSDTNSGFCFEEQDKNTENAEEWLYNSYNEFLNQGHVNLNINEKEIMKYSHSEMARKFNELIKKCLYA